jgi:hypothetical protein
VTVSRRSVVGGTPPGLDLARRGYVSKDTMRRLVSILDRYRKIEHRVYIIVGREQRTGFFFSPSPCLYLFSSHFVLCEKWLERRLSESVQPGRVRSSHAWSAGSEQGPKERRVPKRNAVIGECSAQRLGKQTTLQ